MFSLVIILKYYNKRGDYQAPFTKIILNTAKLNNLFDLQTFCIKKNSCLCKKQLFLIKILLFDYNK